MGGHPFQVSCCWNGLAVINAEPLHRGLRFRSEAVTPNMQRYYVTKASSENPFEKVDACAASECSIMCQDLWGLGYEKIVVDPSVKVTYASSGFRLRENFWPRVTSTIKNYRESWRLLFRRHLGAPLLRDNTKAPAPAHHVKRRSRQTWRRLLSAHRFIFYHSSTAGHLRAASFPLKKTIPE